MNGQMEEGRMEQGKKGNIGIMEYCNIGTMEE